MADDSKMSSKPGFESANPQAYGAIQGDGDSFRELSKIDADARLQRLDVLKSVELNRARWLDDARAEITEERQHPEYTLNPPGIVEKPIEQEAQERVSLKVQGMMAQVETEKQERIEAVLGLAHSTHANPPKQDKAKPKHGEQSSPASKQATNTKTEQSPKDPVKTKRRPVHPLKKETHQIVDRAQDVRIRAGIHFRKFRDTFIERARARGAENAVGSVYRNHVMRLKRIDEAEHRLLDKAFKRHGIDRAPAQSQDYSGPSIQS